MSYRQTLEYLYGLQQFGIKLGLENIQTLLERLGQPQHEYPTLHLAGTNGKGSTAAALSSILTANGYCCGLYTSPHLISFTERIQIDREPIPEEAIIALADEIRSAGQDLPLTFFEFTTAMTLLYFERQKVDVAVIETGLGGRLDATNCLQPEVCLITPVSIDHSDYLGENLTAIATEKAGIFKAGVPVVIGPQDEESLQVLQRSAQQLDCSRFEFNRDYRIIDATNGFHYDGLALQLSDLQPAMVGRHQQCNLAVAIAAAEVLQQKGWTFDAEKIRQAVESVSWPGRLEWWDENLLLDGAHNAQGAQALADYLHQTGRPVHWVSGIKDDKDVHSVMTPILPLCRQVYAAPIDSMPGAPPQTIIEQAQAVGVNGTDYPSATDALLAALKARQGDELVLIAGSLYLLGDLRAYLQQRDFQ